MPTCGGFILQRDVGFDKQLNSTNRNFDTQEKKGGHKMRGKMCLRMFALVNGVNRDGEEGDFDHSFLLPLPPTVHCDTVSDNSNTSFCHCRRANRLIGQPCYPTQTVRPKESTPHFHNGIDRVPGRNDAWKYTHMHPCYLHVYYLAKTRGFQREARRANLKLRCTSSIPPTTHTCTHTQHSHQHCDKKNNKIK